MWKELKHNALLGLGFGTMLFSMLRADTYGPIGAKWFGFLSGLAGGFLIFYIGRDDLKRLRDKNRKPEKQRKKNKS